MPWITTPRPVLAALPLALGALALAGCEKARDPQLEKEIARAEAAAARAVRAAEAAERAATAAGASLTPTSFSDDDAGAEEPLDEPGGDEAETVADGEDAAPAPVQPPPPAPGA